MNFRVVQPNVPQIEKWNKLYFEKNINKLLELTIEENIEENEKVVIWPEVALTYFLTEEPDVVQYLKTKIPKNITLITGGLRREFNNESFKLFNSLYLINSENLDFYDKKKACSIWGVCSLKRVLEIFQVGTWYNRF